MTQLGIHLDPPYLRLCLVNQGKIEHSCLIYDEEKGTLLKEPFPLKGTVISGESPKVLFLKPTTIKAPYSKEALQALQLQIQSSSYFEEEKYIKTFFIQEKEPCIQALIASIPKEALQKHLTKLKLFGIEPDVTSSYALALENFLLSRAVGVEEGIVVHLGSSEWILAVIEKRKLLQSFSISGGIQELLSALWEDRKKILPLQEVEGIAQQIDLLQLKKELNPNLSKRLEKNALDLTHLLSILQTKAAYPLLFTGLTNAFGNLPAFLTQSVKLPLLPDNELKASEEEKKNAVALGLTLSSSLQLLKETFFPRKNWANIGKQFTALWAASCLLAGIFFISGTSLIENQETLLAQKLQSALFKWDPELEHSLFTNKLSSKEKINRWLDSIDSTLQKVHYTAPTPSFSNVLSWLSKQSLHIDQVSYSLEKKPSIEHPKDPYLVKIHLLLQFDSPLTARAWHQELFQSPFVNTSKEITWKTLPNRYECSFYVF